MINTVIIDDEAKAIALLEGYINRVPQLHCLKSFRNPLEALVFVQKNNVDLILLDINMPKLSGISFAKIANDKAKIIFTTAYSEYAVESYNLNAIDYLLKPISFERFLKAISKILYNNKNTINKTDQKFISIKSGYVLHRVNLANILFLEKEANYITYHLTNKKILARESIEEALQKLSNNFLQIHKSYIVAIDKIESIDANQIIIKTYKLPIGKTYKQNLINQLA